MNIESCGRRLWLFALSLACITTACSRQSPPPPEGIRPVKTMVVGENGASYVRSFPGRVEAAKTVDLSFQVPGLVVTLPVKEGQKVARGQMIGQLRSSEFQARREAAQGQLDQGRAVLDALRLGERSRSNCGEKRS